MLQYLCSDSLSSSWPQISLFSSAAGTQTCKPPVFTATLDLVADAWPSSCYTDICFPSSWFRYMAFPVAVRPRSLVVGSDHWSP